jgi:multidrug efflux system outer membrane protein
MHTQRCFTRCHARPVANSLGLVMALLVLNLPACATRDEVSANRATALAQGEVPASWSTQTKAAVQGSGQAPLPAWWLVFDDALLSRLVEQALLANTSVLSAQAALRQARALRDVAQAALWPSLSLSASAGRGKSGGQAAQDTVSAGADARWDIDLFGANRSAVQASEAAAQASAATLGDVQVAIAAEVALNYISLRDAQARWGIARSNLLSQQETSQITQWRMQSGLVTSLESEQAIASAEQTAALLPPLLTSIDQTGHTLSVLTGQAPAALAVALVAHAPVVTPPGAAVPIPRALPAAGIPAQTLRQRADVRAAEWQVRAAWARVAQAQAARAPNFQISGSLGVGARTLGALSDGASVVTALLAGITLPLFDGGGLRAQVRAQQAALDQAQQAYRATVLLALQEVEDALSATRDDGQRLASLQRAAQAASQAAQLARQRYSSGLIDFQTVLETQRTQLSTQSGVASARASLGSDHVLLIKALGGGWQGDDTVVPRLAASPQSHPSLHTRFPMKSTP